MAEQQANKGRKVPCWMSDALAQHQPRCLQVKRPCNRPATWVGYNGREQPLRRSEERQQFLWNATGCQPGVQHFKLCTPAALDDEGSLLCCICGNMTGAWAAAGRRQLPPAELQFIQLVVQQGQSEEWCWQVKLRGWAGCFDFYDFKLDVYVQVDDWYHFSNACRNDAFVRDLRCNAQFADARSSCGGLVRVHHADLAQPDIVMAAIAYASQHNCIVFTASYNTNGCPHVTALFAAAQGHMTMGWDAFGNVLLQWPNCPPGK